MSMKGIRESAEWLGDNAGEPLYQEVFIAVAEARGDGGALGVGPGPHAPDSWRQEDILDRLDRAHQHAYNAYCSMAEEGKEEPTRAEVTHAICDLAIVMALLTEKHRAQQ